MGRHSKAWEVAGKGMFIGRDGWGQKGKEVPEIE